MKLRGYKQKAEAKQERLTKVEEYIKLLELPEEFNLSDLKKAYRKKVLKYHPDKASNEAERIGYEALIKKLNEANEYLKEYLKNHGGRYTKTTQNDTYFNDARETYKNTETVQNDEETNKETNEEINEETNEEYSKTFWDCIGKPICICILTLFVGFCKFYIMKNGISFVLNNITSGINTSVNYKCDSTDVANIVIDIFKKNSPYYKTIEPTTISSIDVSYAVPTSYDKNIKRYMCSATISMKSIQGGFAPAYNNIDKDNFSNSYLAKVTDLDFYNNQIILKSYDTMRLTVTYSSQVSDNNNIIVYLENTLVNNPFSCEQECQNTVVAPQQYASMLGFMPYSYNENYNNEYEYDYDY